VHKCNPGLKQVSHLLIFSLNAINDILDFLKCRFVHIFRRSGFSSHSDLSQEFKMSEDEAKFGCYSQFVSMTLLAVVALFFLVLAIMYASVRSRDAVSFGLEDKSEFSHCTCQPVRLKVSGRMTNAIFFLAANTFPVCSPDVSGSRYATSEVRKIIPVPAVKSYDDL